MAQPPHLNVEKFFDGTYNSDKSVQIHISKNKGKYYRGFTVTNNAALVKKVTDLYKKDVVKADSSNDMVKDGGPFYSTMIIKNNNLDINVGIQYTGTNTCYLFITGPLEAFK
ncbi:MAG: hypothetical protein K2H18_08555 [Muribaculaceae bacterium]|nr:hypothetical protein [Muribaculaceae bacterium]